MAKETFYFPHDYNARNNDKITELIDEYGSMGYGEYWIIAEMLHEDELSRIELTDRFYRQRSKVARMPAETYKSFIEDCCDKYNLMRVENGFLFVDRVDRNKAKRVNVRINRSEAGKAGAEKRWGKNGNCHEKDGKTMANAINPIALANGKMANDSKEKKVKEIKEPSSNEEDIHISAALLEKYKKEHWIGWGTKEEIIKRKQSFTNMLMPFLEKYGPEICNNFWKYWTEPHKNRSGQLRWEHEKFFDFDARLRTFRTNFKETK